MLSTMMNTPLGVTTLHRFGARHFASSRVGDYDGEQVNWRRYDEIDADSARLAHGLLGLGLAEGDRVGTFMWNSTRHLEVYLAVPSMGAVLHTVNCRLSPEHIAYIIDHAGDRFLIVDSRLASVLLPVLPLIPKVEYLIVTGDAASVDDPRVVAYDALLADSPADYHWPEPTENAAAGICYTSGTTGNPKGVQYEHRSTLLHALSGLQPSTFNFTASSVMLPVVPMFHAASWGLPYAGAMAGIKFVFSAVNDPAVLDEVMKTEKVTDSAGVPTVWLAHFQYCDANNLELPKLRAATIGGSAAPRFMIERLMKNGTRVQHAWGMTETSPIGTVGGPTTDWDQLTFDQKVEKTMKQGRPIFGVELRTVDLDDPTKVLPRDGESSGALHIRGPWVVKRYFKAEEDAIDADGWFNTGDVAILHPDGTMQITDRTKDVIKSGGEWISSVELENAAVGHPAVAEAAAIGMMHPKWDERPVLFVVKQEGKEVTAEEVINFLSDKVAKWWLPDAVEFVDDIPHTATGKISKKDLRDRFSDYALEI